MSSVNAWPASWHGPRPPRCWSGGADDRTVPLSIGEAAQELLGTPSLAVIDEAAHAPYLEQPADFNRQIIEFLSSHREAAR